MKNLSLKTSKAPKNNSRHVPCLVFLEPSESKLKAQNYFVNHATSNFNSAARSSLCTVSCTV